MLGQQGQPEQIGSGALVASARGLATKFFPLVAGSIAPAEPRQGNEIDLLVLIDPYHAKALPPRVVGQVADAESEREPRNGEACQTPFTQIAGQAGGGLAVVLVEGGVGIDRRSDAFTQRERSVRNLQAVMELG